MRLIRVTGLLTALSLVAATASAQTLRDCETFEANARNIMMPPEMAVRSFANGAIRVIGLDTVEPACCYAHVLVTHPIPDEPFPGCVLISDTGDRGYSGLDMARLEASYDPQTGLTIAIPAGRYRADGTTELAPLTVTVNQATGQVAARR